MKRKMLMFVLIATMATSIAACGRSESSSAEPTASVNGTTASSSIAVQQEKQKAGQSRYDSDYMHIDESSPLYVEKNTTGKNLKFGMIVEEMSPFMSQVCDGAQAFADEHDDVEITVAVGDNDVAKELSSVENFIANGYDAIEMKPYDSEGCAPAVQYCNDANIPIVAVNNNFSSVQASTYVGSDHELSGEMAAEGMAETLGGKGNVVILTGAMDQQAAIDRVNGVHKVLEEYPDINIVDEQDANWSTDEAQTKTENWISSGKEFDGIIATCSQMALGAQLALESAGYNPGDIPIASIDAMEMSLEIYKTGWVTSDVLQDAWGQGYMGAAACYALVNGKKLDSYIDVPYVKVEKDEVDKYLSRYS
jgi:inositol transport system substrate-binding protein